MAAQLPRFFALDFSLYLTCIGVGGGNGDRLAGHSGAGAVFHRKGVAVRGIVILAYLIPCACRDFKFFAFAEF